MFRLQYVTSPSTSPADIVKLDREPVEAPMAAIIGSIGLFLMLGFFLLLISVDLNHFRLHFLMMLENLGISKQKKVFG